jgi:hypothetical protein
MPYPKLVLSGPRVAGPPIVSKSAAISKTRARVPPRIAQVGDAALVQLTGLIDERFPGFGDLSSVRVAVIDLAGVTFVTSFGVRQWLISMAAVPPNVSQLYLLNCPSIIVDQLNMIFNFGGRSQVVSLSAPFLCPQCGAESKHTIDVLAEGPALAQGQLAPRRCTKCSATLELDEILDSYFACLNKYGAKGVDPSAARLIAQGAHIATKEVKATAPQIPAGATSSPGMAATAVEVAPSGRRSLAVAAIVVVVGALATAIYVLVAPS